MELSTLPGVKSIQQSRTEDAVSSYRRVVVSCRIERGERGTVL